jgi:hypothetical protein
MEEEMGCVTVFSTRRPPKPDTQSWWIISDSEIIINSKICSLGYLFLSLANILAFPHYPIKTKNNVKVPFCPTLPDVKKDIAFFFKVPQLCPYDLLIIIIIIILIWSWVGSTGTMIWRGRETWIIQINTCPSATYSATDFRWTVPGLKLVLHVNLQYTWNSVLHYKKTVVSLRILRNISSMLYWQR